LKNQKEIYKGKNNQMTHEQIEAHTIDELNNKQTPFLTKHYF
jgi:hypothetical protein